MLSFSRAKMRHWLIGSFSFFFFYFVIPRVSNVCDRSTIRDIEMLQQGQRNSHVTDTKKKKEFDHEIIFNSSFKILATISLSFIFLFDNKLCLSIKECYVFKYFA